MICLQKVRVLERSVERKCKLKKNNKGKRNVVEKTKRNVDESVIDVDWCSDVVSS